MAMLTIFDVWHLCVSNAGFIGLCSERVYRVWQIVYAPQPIKCVEAVFVALYLTVSFLPFFQ
jgi:hypothetical protein